MSETIRDGLVVARKLHRCIWCGGDIERGEQYWQWVGIHDGDFQNNRFHRECFDACNTYCDPEFGFDPYSNPRGGYDA